MIGHLQSHKRGLGVSGHLGTLAGETRPAEVFSLGRHVPPHVTATNVPEQGVASLVSEAVDTREKSMDQSSRHDRAGLVAVERDVAEDGTVRHSINRNPDWTKSRRGIVDV